MRMLLLALVGCAALATFGCGSGMGDLSNSLVVLPGTVDFGEVLLGNKVNSNVDIVNYAPVPVTIGEISVAGQAFTAQTDAGAPVSIPAGGTRTVQVGFAPNSVTEYQGQVSVTNLSADTKVHFGVHGHGTTNVTRQLTLSATSLDFGNVTVQGKVTRSLTLTSNGTSPVTVNAATISGRSFTVVSSSLPITLNPSQSMTLVVQFTPSAARTASGQLTISSNATSGGTQVISLSGTGTAAPSPQLTVNATNLDFGNVTVNSATTQPLTLTSTGNAPLTVNSVAVSGAGFMVVNGTLPATLNPNESLTLQVRFKPTVAQAASGQVTIDSNASNSSRTGVSLSGTGTAAANPQLTLSAMSLRFGNVTVNVPTIQPLTLTSTGTSPVTVSTATVSGSGFTLVGGNLPTTLKPTESITLQVQFNPAAAGAVNGQLSIQSDSTNGNTATVRLSGTGTAAANPQLTLSAQTLSYGNVTLNTPTTQPLTLTSTGSSSVTVSAATISGAGFTLVGSTLPVTLNPTQSLTLQVQFNPAATGAASGALTLQSNSSSGGVSVVSLDGTGVAVPSPQLTLSAQRLSFGKVTVNTPTTQPLTLTSTGSSPVTVSAATVSGTGFSIVGSKLPVTLNPTQSLTLQVQFNPTGTDAANGQLSIRSNSNGNATAIVPLSGTGVGAPSPQLTVSAQTLSFGNVTLNAPTTQSLTLSSTGTAPVTVNTATISGRGFTIVNSTGLPTTLNAGQTMSLSVRFNPTSAGAATGQLTINSNSPTAGTVTVALSGTGVAAVSPQLTVSATSLGFSQVAVNASSSLTVTLSSTGTSPVTVSAATVTGAGFSVIGGSLPSVLNVGQSLTLQVQFKPTTAGTANGTLTISSNSGTGGTAVVALSGTGTASNPILAVSVTSLSFGSLTVDSTVTQSVTLSSTGTTSVTVNSVSISGAGFTLLGGSFPLTLAPGKTATLQVQFKPSAAGAVTGQLVVNSDSTGGSKVVALSGTGKSADIAHGVDLSWNAPTSSADPVAGYHVYRATGGGSPILLNSTPQILLTYSDNSVVSGTVYIYSVKSVDAKGVESVSSNTFQATIP